MNSLKLFGNTTRIFHQFSIFDPFRIDNFGRDKSMMDRYGSKMEVDGKWMENSGCMTDGSKTENWWKRWKFMENLQFKIWHFVTNLTVYILAWDSYVAWPQNQLVIQLTLRTSHKNRNVNFGFECLLFNHLLYRNRNSIHNAIKSYHCKCFN